MAHLVSTIVLEERVASRPERGDRMLHAEHPERIGEAWCGAPVLGVRGRNLGPLDCVVCAELRAGRRARRD